jgi:hypothetical protein
MKHNKNVKNWIGCWKALRGKTDRMKELGSVDLWNQRANMFAKKLKPKKKIREYYKTSAVDGTYCSRSDGYTGMMVWNVNVKD